MLNSFCKFQRFTLFKKMRRLENEEMPTTQPLLYFGKRGRLSTGNKWALTEIGYCVRGIQPREHQRRESQQSTCEGGSHLDLHPSRMMAEILTSRKKGGGERNGQCGGAVGHWGEGSRDANSEADFRSPNDALEIRKMTLKKISCTQPGICWWWLCIYEAQKKTH